MDNSSIAGRTESLRREIALIRQEEERRYHNHEIHSPLDELKTLIEKVKQQVSHGLVWYS